MAPILIIGRSDDRCCELVHAEAGRQGHEVLFLAEDQAAPTGIAADSIATD